MKRSNSYLRLYYLFTALIIITAIVSCSNNPPGYNPPSNNSEIIKKASGPPEIERVLLNNQDSTIQKAKGGTVVRVLGNNLKFTKSVTFNGASAFLNPALTLEHKITVRVPKDAPFRNVPDRLVVTNSAGSDSMEFYITPPPPIIDGFSPSVASAGHVVTIYGSIFIGVKTVRIGDVIAPIVSSSYKQIKVKVPKGSPSGIITVTTLGGSASTVHPFGVGLIIYQDDLNPIFKNGTYGATINFDNTEHVFKGKNSIKLHFQGSYTAFVATSDTPVSLANSDTLEISIYAPEPNHWVKVFFGNQVPPYTEGYGNQVKLDIEAGKYKTFYVPLSEMGDPRSFKEFFVQNGPNKTNFTIYIDNVVFH